MKTRRQYQYKGRFEPIDDGGPPPQMTPEYWPEHRRPVKRRRLAVARVPAIFFLDQPAPAVDAGEWQTALPQKALRRKQPQQTYVFQPQEVVFANPNDGLRTFDPPYQPRKRRALRQPIAETPHIDAAPQDTGEWAFKLPERIARHKALHGESYFAPPEVSPPNPNDGLKTFEQPYQPRKRKLLQRIAAFDPPHVDAAAPVDTLEWLYRQVYPALRRRPILGESVFMPPEVAALQDTLDWQAKVQQPKKRKPQVRGAAFSHVDEDTLEWLFRAPRQIERRRPTQGGQFAPVDVLPPSPDSLEWLFKPPRVYRRELPRYLMPYHFQPLEPWEIAVFIPGLKGWNATQELNAWNSRTELEGWNAEDELTQWNADKELA